MPTYPVYANSRAQAIKDITKIFKNRENSTDITITKVQLIKAKMVKTNGVLAIQAKHYRISFDFKK